MSVVIVGGNERMVCQYEDICKGFGCKAKVFAKEKGAMKKKIGVPDLMILFTSKEKIHSGMPLSHKQRCSS